MSEQTDKSLSSIFLTTLNGTQTATPPIWFMRQAGRYLPEYRKVRAQAGSFLDLCFNSELASEVTLQPIHRFDLDAAILFADILLIPHALGQNVSFVAGEGPRLEPVTTTKEISTYQTRDILPSLSPVFETIKLTRAALAPEKALIGFAGAPWTVATYMLAGGPLKDPAALRAVYYQNPEFINTLIDLLTENTIAYLIAQIEAGVDAIQLFDSWAGGLPGVVLETVSVKPLEKIAKRLKSLYPDIPIILFPKGVGEKAGEYAALKDCNAVGIDYSMDPSFAREKISPMAVVQGGLDPLLVVEGGSNMYKSAQNLLNVFHDVPYVFNLGHGFVPETPPEHVADLVKNIRSGNWG